jgi:hypothetical protein
VASEKINHLWESIIFTQKDIWFWKNINKYFEKKNRYFKYLFENYKYSMQNTIKYIFREFGFKFMWFRSCKNISHLNPFFIAHLLLGKFSFSLESFYLLSNDLTGAIEL